MIELKAPENIKNILITDDDSFLLDMYATRFSHAKFVVSTSSSAEETIKKLKDGFTPHIMLMDVVMPVTDGFEMLEAINKEGLAQKTIKIFLTNLGQQEDIDKGKVLGALGYIVKANSTPSEVVEQVLQIIHDHE
jgi:CheY-like chemotaxis protein